MLNSLETARLCAEAAEDKKAFDLLILDLRGLTYITDYFVICSANTAVQASAINDGVNMKLAQEGLRPLHIEGEREASWVLMDYGDVVVHIFEEGTRNHYSLEKLWGEAPRIAVADRTAS
jgi:ribosome-associated protein